MRFVVSRVSEARPGAPAPAVRRTMLARKGMFLAISGDREGFEASRPCDKRQRRRKEGAPGTGKASKVSSEKLLHGTQVGL